MKKSYLLILLILILIGCNTYKPFSNRKEKNESISYVKKTYDLSNKQIRKLDDTDSILMMVAFEKTDNVKKKYKMRLDSFFLGKFDRKQLAIILELDKTFPDMDFYFQQANGGNMPEFKNIGELKSFIKHVDSVLEKEVIIKVDSTQKKKQ